MNFFSGKLQPEAIKMHLHDTLPAVAGALVTVLLELKQGITKALISGIISFASAFYIVPAILYYMTLKFPANHDFFTNHSVISAAGFIGGLVGGKVVKLTIYFLDSYATPTLIKFLNRVLNKSNTFGDN